MPHDPFDDLALAVTPIAPRPAFAADLRRRIVAALGRDETTAATTATTSTTTAGGRAMTVTDTTPTTTPWVPDELSALTPYIAVDGAREAIAWYQEVLGATPDMDPIVMPDGRVGHAQLRFSGALIMLSDAHPEIGVVAPDPEASAVSLQLYVPDCDATIALAEQRGALVTRPPADTPYGHRGGVVVDPWGHRWFINTALRAVQGAPDPTDSTVDLGAREAAAAAATVQRTEDREQPVGRQGDIGHWTLSVPDAELGKAFYGNVLGWVFEEGSVPGAWGVVGVLPGGGMWGGSVEEHPAYPHGVSHCYQVDDMAAALARVREAGGTAGEPDERHYGILAECVDDQGTNFQLWQPPADAPT